MRYNSLLNEFFPEIAQTKQAKAFLLHPKGVPTDVEERLRQRALAANLNFTQHYLSGTIMQDAISH